MKTQLVTSKYIINEFNITLLISSTFLEQFQVFKAFRRFSFLLLYYYKKHVYEPRYNTGSEVYRQILTQFCSREKYCYY